MTIDEAKKINADVFHWCFGHVVGEPSAAPPPEYPLADMLDASRLMRGHREPSDRPGASCRYAVCDDRLIAAMYVLGRYDASSPGDADPILCGAGKAVCVVDLAELLQESAS